MRWTVLKVAACVGAALIVYYIKYDIRAAVTSALSRFLKCLWKYPQCNILIAFLENAVEVLYVDVSWGLMRKL
jgi:hypothetical protein